MSNLSVPFCSKTEHIGGANPPSRVRGVNPPIPVNPNPPNPNLLTLTDIVLLPNPNPDLTLISYLRGSASGPKARRATPLRILTLANPHSGRNPCYSGDLREQGRQN